jgi:hypothetical protein
MRTYVASEELVLSEEAEERRLLGVVPDNFQAGQSARTARLEGRVVATERGLHVVTNQRCARVIFINHIPLNGYLTRFHRVQSAHCPACSESNETVEHYLIHCPGYAHERWSLKQKLGDKLTLTSLLANDKALIPLANFIDASQRFTYKVSDVTTA